MATKKSTQRRSFGSIKQQRSGRFQASYVGPDQVRHPAPQTFTTRMDGEAWLSAERRLIEWDEWTPPAAREAARRAEDVLTLRSYVELWLPQRVAARRLAPRTLSGYERYLDRLILPSIGDVRMKDFSPATIKAWLAGLDQSTPRMNHNVYTLLKSIFLTAVQDEVIEKNPCREILRKPKRDIAEPATLDELAKITLALPERLRLMVELSAWCALRFGEVAELRRSDIAIERDDAGQVIGATVKVRRAVQWVKHSRDPERGDAEKIVKPPKADSIRDVAIPPHLAEAVKDHLNTHAQWGADGLLFPTTNGGQYRAETFHKAFWRKARQAAGREDLRFHDLRHTGATLAAASGATLRELMDRLGHSTMAAALAYQHTAQGADKRIANELSRIAQAATSSAKAN